MQGGKGEMGESGCEARGADEDLQLRATPRCMDQAIKHPARPCCVHAPSYQQTDGASDVRHAGHLHHLVTLANGHLLQDAETVMIEECWMSEIVQMAMLSVHKQAHCRQHAQCSSSRSAVSHLHEISASQLIGSEVVRVRDGHAPQRLGDELDVIALDCGG